MADAQVGSKRTRSSAAAPHRALQDEIGSDKIEAKYTSRAAQLYRETLQRDAGLEGDNSSLSPQLSREFPQCIMLEFHEHHFASRYAIHRPARRPPRCILRACPSSRTVEARPRLACAEKQMSVEKHTSFGSPESSPQQAQQADKPKLAAQVIRPSGETSGAETKSKRLVLGAKVTHHYCRHTVVPCAGHIKQLTDSFMDFPLKFAKGGL